MNATAHNFYPSIDDDIGFGNGRRFDMAIGLNSSGNQVAVLPTDLVGGYNFDTAGPSYTLSDDNYHTFQLVYNPASQTADLSIDGIDRITGYAGQTRSLIRERSDSARTTGERATTVSSRFSSAARSCRSPRHWHSEPSASRAVWSALATPRRGHVG